MLSHEASSDPATGEGPTPTSHAEPMTDVLVIDDDPAVLLVMTTVLKMKGYSLHSASDGARARELLGQHRFRLIITDIYMPNADGLEVIMHCTAAQPQTPILAISGGGKFRSTESSLRPAKCLGSRRTLAKPFELDDFINVVREMIGAPGSPALGAVSTAN